MYFLSNIRHALNASPKVALANTQLSNSRLQALINQSKVAACLKRKRTPTTNMSKCASKESTTLVNADINFLNLSYASPLRLRSTMSNVHRMFSNTEITIGVGEVKVMLREITLPRASKHIIDWQPMRSFEGT